ncbi:YciI family protein [Nocardioides bruguierae]|uniref:YciI family protein n=1 Tax=Nocardioides bruguierae TaxID=2945102 RepID=A0A9X2D5I4_9ACTN|nr:YciI family protein [Nocardioides bruguierae]MCL8024139.1 YciI family protein [Nocardioides bruguierae]MCM0619842.1 YciI family protein [Nocardioides bruguierae]
MTTTEYAVLLTADESAWETATPEEQAATFEVHSAFAAALEARGHTITGGMELHPAATATVLAPDGAGGVRTTQGPFAEAAEQLGGLYTVASADLEDLLEVCRMLVATGATIEVRAAVDHGGQA